MEPIRARKLTSNGYLEPFIKLNNFDNIEQANCDRDSLGDVYFADMGVSVVRSRCLIIWIKIYYQMDG